jgi:hypothetical protein
MAARTPPPASARPADAADVELAGWDPYIVSLTGTGDGESVDARTGNGTPDTRKGQIMAWLREHGA